MKKITIALFILLFSISIFGNISIVGASQVPTSWGWWSASSIDNVNAWDLLNQYKPKKVVWSSSWDMDLDGGFKDKVNSYLRTISTILWVVAVWALVYAGMLMQFSGWEDEKVSKAKKIIKWAIIWFILLISASAIVYIIINVMFALG